MPFFIALMAMLLIANIAALAVFGFYMTEFLGVLRSTEAEYARMHREGDWTLAQMNTMGVHAEAIMAREAARRSQPGGATPGKMRRPGGSGAYSA
jgi:hypothetical protein